jgi:hypothetical protein
MASTGTGSRGNRPVFQLNGAVTIPSVNRTIRMIQVISLFSRKYFTILFNIDDML